MKTTNLWLIICLQILCVIVLPACNEENKIALSSKIRAAYWLIKPVEQAEEKFRLLKEHGLNAALVADTGYRLQENLWQGWGATASKHDIQLFPVLLFAVPQEMKEKYVPYTNRYGIIYHATPCPLDNHYWNTVIGQRFKQLALLSITSPIPGMIFDTEMYGSNISIYGDPCFCDLCWQRFVRAEQPVISSKNSDHQDVVNLAGEQRFEYLIQHQLLQQYSTFQEQQLQMILAQIETQIHSINPHLFLGFLGYRDNWFYAGLIRGLGTTRKPVMVFSESTYVRGYTPYVTKEKRSIEKKAERRTPNVGKDGRSKEATQRMARYIPGLWLGRFFSDELPSQLYTLARHTDGYWIYSADNLWDADRKPRNSALHGSYEEYWVALKKANDELKRFSKTPESFQSEITPVPHLFSFYDTVQNRLITQPFLKHFMHNTFLSAHQGSQSLTVPQFLEFGRIRESTLRNSPEITYRGKTLFHCLKNDGGTIEITHVPVGKYKDYTSYKLFDDKGQIFHEGFVGYSRMSTIITLPTDISGFFSLLTDSGTGAAQVSFSQLPFIIEASSTFPLTTINTAHAYAFYVKPGKKKIKLRAYCLRNTSASLTIHSTDERVNQQTDIIEFTEIRIPVPRTHGNLLQIPSSSRNGIDSVSFDRSFQEGQNFWTMTISPVLSKSFEEVRFYLYDEEFPYLFTTY